MRAPLHWLLVVQLGGCPALLPVDDDSAGGWAPRIVASSPTGVATVPACGAVEFQVRGEDEDSLELNWAFALDGSLEGSGTSTDGTLLAELELYWDAALAGGNAEVLFTVSDGEHETRVLWPVEFDPPTACR